MYYSPEKQQRFTYHSEIRSAFPEVSFPVEMSDAVLEDFGVFLVSQGSPTFDPRTHKAVDVGVEAGGPTGWQVRWSIVALTAEEAAAAKGALQAAIVAQTQKRLDAFAQTRGYDDIKSACGYVGCSVARFAAEGTYCRDARAETWDALYTMLAEVEAGTRPIPTGYSDIEPELPVLEWPAQ